MIVPVLLIFNYSLLGPYPPGDDVQFGSARSLALGGGSSILEEPSALAENVAVIGLFDKKSISLTLKGLFYNECRSLRVYDQYGNNIGQSAIYDYSTNETDFHSAALIFPLRFISLGLGLRPVWDFDYEFYEEARNEFYQLKSIENMISQGCVKNFKQGAALSTPNLKFGVGHSYYFGQKYYYYNKYDFTTRSEETEENEERCQGNGIDLGLILSYKTHLRCGLSSQFPGRIRIGQFENRLPFTGRVAVFYQPSFRPPSRVMGEVAGLGWHYIDSTKKNVYLFKFGVEHRIAQEYFLRYGFNLCPDYRNTNIWQTTLTFGFGFTLKPLVIDFAYGLSRRNFQARDFEQLNNLRPTNMYIEENIHNLLLTFNFYL